MCDRRRRRRRGGHVCLTLYVGWRRAHNLKTMMMKRARNDDDDVPSECLIGVMFSVCVLVQGLHDVGAGFDKHSLIRGDPNFEGWSWPIIINTGFMRTFRARKSATLASKVAFLLRRGWKSNKTYEMQ